MSPLCFTERTPIEPKVLIVSPHPDDEVIGAGAALRWLKNAVVVEVSDGSPADLRDARENGFSTREDYRKARADELRAALALGGISRVIELGIGDQEVSFVMGALARKLAELIARERPDVILTMPYEGGHPDHDGTAFAVAQAVERSKSKAAILEMTSYHHREGGCHFCEFLSNGEEGVALRLTPEECALKRLMFGCFRTQAKVLQWFPVGVERFRRAPTYDFLQAPHPGELYYEKFPWGLSGREWRELAERASRELNCSHLMAA